MSKREKDPVAGPSVSGGWASGVRVAFNQAAKFISAPLSWNLEAGE